MTGRHVVAALALVEKDHSLTGTAAQLLDDGEWWPGLVEAWCAVQP